MTGTSMAERTSSSRTRAALGTLADAMLAAVDVNLKWQKHVSKGFFSNYLMMLLDLHDGDEVSCLEDLVVHLRDEDGGDGDEERGAVHVDGGADGQHELGDAPVHLGLLHAAERDGKSRGTGPRKVKKREKKREISICSERVRCVLKEIAG